MEYKKKLIEVALPLEDINAACLHEKRNVRSGHPSSLHMWWARRPFLAARAVIWASLVDDPSSHPEEYPTEELQNKERERLFGILKELVRWENSNNKEVLEKAKAEILKSTNNNPPALLDPFAGGGAIPFEAARLGLKAYASDLNPVAVMINKAMIEIPPCFQNMMPVHPNPNSPNKDFYIGVQGLAEDVEYYGNLLKEKAFEKVGHLYPKVKYINPKSQKEEEATVIAWIWSRTIKCPNPACEAEVPLIHSFDLSKKKGHEYHVEISYNEKKQAIFKISEGLAKNLQGTINRNGAICPHCGASIDYPALRNTMSNGEFGDKLMAIVLESPNGRIYVEANNSQSPYYENSEYDFPTTKLTGKAIGNIGLYGFTETSKLFTKRQLLMLSTLSELIPDIRNQVIEDAMNKLLNDSLRLSKGETGTIAYADAISVYLSFVIDRLSGYNNTCCSWDSSLQKIRTIFSRQAIPMVWDYVESNPFCDSTGSFTNMFTGIVKALKELPNLEKCGEAVQWDATQDNGLRNIMISTDPPYYDNICYADLSDFFYVWMRNSLKDIYPNVFGTISTPKEQELIASPYRFKKKTEAKEFFENGMLATCENLFNYSRKDIPVTIYYAFKQTNADDSGSSSTGWETMLSAILKAGFSITGTWPMRTEMENRSIASESNALASSIIIVCRKVDDSKQSTTMRLFADELKSELLPAVQKLQDSNIAPVDLAQSAIGPGIAVYSRYKSIIQADGSELSVRDALKLINRELDNILNEHDSDIDTESSLCLALYSQKGYNEWTFGDVNTLATAKNTSVDALARIGIVESGKGKVRVYERNELKPFSGTSKCIWLITQQAVRAFENDGFTGIAENFADISESDVSKVKKLCYQLFSIADKKKWTNEAIVYNSVITSWDDAISSVSVIRDKRRSAKQLEFNLEV